MLDNVKEIHIEPTSLCNAQCPMCARNIYGEKLNPYIKLKSLPVAWFHDNINPSQIKNLNKIFFCGNVGDPASAPDLIEIIEYFKSVNKNIVVGMNSNGALRNTEWWKSLGQVLDGELDYCVFSIDGFEDTNHIHRRNVRWDILMNNLDAYLETGATAHCDMLVFKHNKHQVEDFKQWTKNKGFTLLFIKETDRWDTYVNDIGLEPVYPYEKQDYKNLQVSCERDRDNSIYLDYLGKFWPCCHMAEAYLNKIGQELHKDIRGFTNNELFKEYYTRLDNNPFYICKRACNVKTGKRSQFKETLRFK